MSGQPDFQTACETLIQAIDEAVSVLMRTCVMVNAGLRVQSGEELSIEELCRIKNWNSPE